MQSSAEIPSTQPTVTSRPLLCAVSLTYLMKSLHLVRSAESAHHLKLIGTKTQKLNYYYSKVESQIKVTRAMQFSRMGQQTNFDILKFELGYEASGNKTKLINDSSVSLNVISVVLFPKPRSQARILIHRNWSFSRSENHKGTGP